MKGRPPESASTGRILLPGVLRLAYYDGLRRSVERVKFGRRICCVTEHGLVFGECVGIPGRCRPQHHHRKSRSHWRRHTIVIRHEVERDTASRWSERCPDFAHQLLAGRRIEVMEEVRYQHQIVGSSKLRLERVTGE